MTRQIAWILAGAALGGALGYFQVFCPTGECALTGSWYGGAVIGGLLGLVLSSGGCCGRASGRADESDPSADRPAPEPDADPDDRNPYRG